MIGRRARTCAALCEYISHGAQHVKICCLMRGLTYRCTLPASCSWARRHKTFRCSKHLLRCQ